MSVLGRVRNWASVLVACLAAGACAQGPFDATSPWTPGTGNSDASYAGGMLGDRPSGGFAAFESDASSGVAGDVVLPGAGGENPWATEARNVVVTVCYGRLVNTVDEVQQAAQGLCPDGSKAVFIGQDGFWNGCPLLQPTRAAFQCRPAGDDASPEAAESGDKAGTAGREGGPTPPESPG